MKIALVLHGFPPELVGGTENSVQALARAFVAIGHEVVVIAGSMQWEGGARTSTATDTDPASGRQYTVHRIHRSDAYFDHWQKGHSPVAGRMFEELLAAERPDIVHVQHWIRLSRDLVVRAARLGIPSVVTLNDLWSTCLVAFRVHPSERAFCERRLAPENCLDCAAYVPPRTPWLDLDEQAAEVEAHRASAAAELGAARALIAPSSVHALAALGWLGLEGAHLEERVVVLPPAREPAATGRAPKAVPARFTTDEPLVLASFGQWSELKGTDLLIEALGLLPEPGRVRLLLAGGAPFPAFAARVEQLAAACPAAVCLLGGYDHSDLAAHPVAGADRVGTGTRPPG
ncbi:MAG: glycosyltransferase, partial [Planctomycetota bacterium]|nr:glycosyltransferase [Planctomycetota bacterium]